MKVETAEVIVVVTLSAVGLYMLTEAVFLIVGILKALTSHVQRNHEN